jgi:hypothetical protein
LLEYVHIISEPKHGSDGSVNPCKRCFTASHQSVMTIYVMMV